MVLRMSMSFGRLVSGLVRKEMCIYNVPGANPANSNTRMPVNGGDCVILEMVESLSELNTAD